MLKTHSGIETIYFRLKTQRRTIFNGSEAINRNRLASTINRTNPIFTKNFLKMVPTSMKVSRSFYFKKCTVQDMLEPEIFPIT